MSVLSPDDHKRLINDSGMPNTIAFAHKYDDLVSVATSLVPDHRSGTKCPIGIMRLLSFETSYLDEKGKVTHTEGVLVARTLSGKRGQACLNIELLQINTQNITKNRRKKICCFLKNDTFHPTLN